MDKNKLIKNVTILSTGNIENIDKFNDEEKNMFQELINNGCIYKTKAKRKGLPANPYNKTETIEVEAYTKNEYKLNEIYGIDSLY